MRLEPPLFLLELKPVVIRQRPASPQPAEGCRKLTPPLDIVADSIWHGTALRHSTRSTNSNSHRLQNFYKSVTQYGRSRSVPSLTPTLTSRHHHSTCSLAQIQRLVVTDPSISSSCWTAVNGVQSLSVGISDGAESSSSAVCDLNTNRGAAATRSPMRRNGDRRNAAC